MQTTAKLGCYKALKVQNDRLKIGQVIMELIIESVLSAALLNVVMKQPAN